MADYPYAFPCPAEAGVHNGTDGMSLRDWFAGQVLPALLQDGVRGDLMKHDDWPDGLAHDAYRIANAMLRRREKE